MHLVVNRVHPTKFTAISVPRRDYFILDRSMREVERKFGCSRAQGPYVTVDMAEGPKIVRMSRRERQTRGLLQDPEGPRLTARAQRAEQNLSGKSFQTWITCAPAAALRQAPICARIDRLLMRGPQPPWRIVISVSVHSPPMCR